MIKYGEILLYKKLEESFGVDIALDQSRMYFHKG